MGWAMRRYSKTDLALLKDNLGAELPAPEPKKKRSQEESAMQRALVAWWHMNCRVFGVPEILLFSIPNGGWRPNPITGSILKAEGLRRGAPDLFLAVAQYWRAKDGRVSLPELDTNMIQRRYYGLFLELKRREGVVSPEQEVFHELLQKQGYKVVVCRTLADCINQITTYLTCTQTLRRSEKSASGLYS